MLGLRVRGLGLVDRIGLGLESGLWLGIGVMHRGYRSGLGLGVKLRVTVSG